VDLRGVEPLSENLRMGISTSLVAVLRFPSVAPAPQGRHQVVPKKRLLCSEQHTEQFPIKLTPERKAMGDLAADGGR